MRRTVSIGQIAEYLEEIAADYIIYGDLNKTVEGFSPLTRYQENTITWIKNIEKYKRFNDAERKITPMFIVIDRAVESVSSYPNRLVCDNPKYIFSSILKKFFEDKTECGIGKGSIVSDKAFIEKGVSIGCNCIIEDNVTIGEGTKIYHNVVICKGTSIGKKCIIKSGTVIGEEGYGYSRYKGKTLHVPHLGNVVLGDEVEIGSNCSIDRGMIESTIIGTGSKIDNLCHIAHNVQIGKNVMIVANSVICGSVRIRDDAYVAPGGIIKNQIEVGEKCVIGIGSVVLNSVPSNKVLVGVPARQLRDVGNEDL